MSLLAGVAIGNTMANVVLIGHMLRTLAQIMVILAVTRACGWLFERMRQPRVIGEIAGGILLGPIALGQLFPELTTLLFPPATLVPLESISRFGLAIFLFLTGSELDLKALRRNRGATLAVTVGSIVVPFALGAAIAPWLLARFGLPHTGRLGFVLFVGIAISITALPVLARILQDRRAAGHALSATTATTSLVCAAANDLAAWALLAVAITLIHTQQRGQNLAITLGELAVLLGYVAVMLLVVRPVIKRLLFFSRRELPVWLWLPFSVAFAILSAAITEKLGVHAFFGAFLAGTCVPTANRPAAVLERAFERTFRPLIAVTLPIFFALTGLRMQPGAFADDSAQWFALILAVAVVGKIGGAAGFARAARMPWKTASEIGILMNTRGLVELIVLTIGLKQGVLSPQLFTLFVLMAVATTAMTVPLLDLSTRTLALWRTFYAPAGSRP